MNHWEATALAAPSAERSFVLENDTVAVAIAGNLYQEQGQKQVRFLSQSLIKRSSTTVTQN